MNAKISLCVIFVKAIIYLLLHNLHDCTFNNNIIHFSGKHNFFINSFFRQLSLNGIT